MTRCYILAALAASLASAASAEGDVRQTVASTSPAVAALPIADFTLAPAPHVPMRTVPALAPSIDETLLAAQPVRRRNARPGWTISD